MKARMHRDCRGGSRCKSQNSPPTKHKIIGRHSGGNLMWRTGSIAAVAAIALSASGAAAQDSIKVGIVMPLTGQLAPVGKQVVAAARLYVQEHGDKVAGKTIELIVKDDAGVPDNSKRLAQELIVNDKGALIGAGITPSALSIAPLATQA